MYATTGRSADVRVGWCRLRVEWWPLIFMLVAVFFAPAVGVDRAVAVDLGALGHSGPIV